MPTNRPTKSPATARCFLLRSLLSSKVSIPRPPQDTHLLIVMRTVIIALGKHYHSFIILPRARVVRLETRFLFPRANSKRRVAL